MRTLGAGPTFEAATVATGLADATVGVDWLVPTNEPNPFGGVVVRATDANNYLIARYSEGMLTIFRRQAGVWTVLGPSAPITVAPGSSHRLTVTTSGTTVTVAWDGAPTLTVTEPFNQLATAHGVIWAPFADALTAYDNLHVQTADVTPPVISSPTASAITGSGATISWTTNEPSDSQVDYGPTTAYGSSSALNSSAVTSHLVPLSGLSGNTLYHFRVRSRDTAGNLKISGDFTFTTVASDTTAPVISAVTAASLTSSGATISWTTNEASDTQVDYGLTTAYGSASALNTSLVTAHTATLSGLAGATLYHYRVRSRDAAGNLGLSTDRTFTTLDGTAPSVSITAPAAGAIVAGTVSVTASASDNVGVAGVQFRLDGAPLGAEDTLAPYSVSWNASAASPGLHTLTAVARDAVGNITTSTPVAVTVPVATVQVSLVWDANTEPNLAGYRVYVGTASGVYGAPIDVGNVTAFTVTGLQPGTYFFVVTAYNTSGAESTVSNEVSATR